MTDLSIYQLTFLSEITAAGIEFIVVGGRAMQAHGLDRETVDLDILVSRNGITPERLHRVIVCRAGLQNPNFTPGTLRLPQKRMSLPSEEFKEIDILTSIGALDFDLSMAQSEKKQLAVSMIPIMSISDLIYSKLVALEHENRPAVTVTRDRDDLSALLSHWRLKHNCFC